MESTCRKSASEGQVEEIKVFGLNNINLQIFTFCNIVQVMRDFAINTKEEKEDRRHVGKWLMPSIREEGGVQAFLRVVSHPRLGYISISCFCTDGQISVRIKIKITFTLRHYPRPIQLVVLAGVGLRRSYRGYVTATKSR